MISCGNLVWPNGG